MNRSMVTALVLVGIWAGSSADALAGSWRVCNRTPDPLEVAVGYAVDGGHLQSEGWWTLAACGGCASVVQSQETVDRSRVYLYAQKAKGNVPVFTGPETLCVANQPFTIRGARNCERRDFKSKAFQAVQVDLTKQFTTNITGERQCNL